MACTKQVYTAAPTWTAIQLADTFRSAFIDAGLMTDWYDSFLSGTVENRIMQIVNDNTKTYGTIYYWFMFTTGGVFLQTITGFNTTTHVPTGTLYQDYFATTTNATTNHLTVMSLVNTTQFTITRYTSQENTDASFFYLRNGTSYLSFFFGKGTFRNPNSFIDQNKFYYNGHIYSIVESSPTVYYCSINFRHIAPHTRRTIFGSTLGSRTSLDVFTTAKDEYGYIRTQLDNANTTSTSIANGGQRIAIPCGRTTMHTGLTENYQPLVTGIVMSPYLPALPADFGIATYADNNTMVVGDTFVVSSGSNEWDILGVSKATTSTAAGQIMFVARTI